jgi:hypothetical protein
MFLYVRKNNGNNLIVEDIEIFSLFVARDGL